MKTRFILLLITLCTSLVFVSAKLYEQAKKNYVAFDQNLYAGRYEITNLEYNLFLADLKATNQNELYSKYIYDSTQWNQIFPKSDKGPYQTYYHNHQVYNHYPVVNITLEAAQSYCNWLTDKYHQNPERKYQKVIFRLPTEKEWIALAKPLPDHNLPWEGNSPFKKRKKQKYYLANIKSMDKTGENYCMDGAIFTLIVGHYKPNDLGFYDVIGNVAEMTADGKIKGGSWNNTLEECTTDKTQSLTLPSPYVGFRVVMEVIE